MDNSTIMTLIPLYSVRGTIQIRFEGRCKKWKRIKRRITLLPLTMARKHTTATFTSCVDDVYVSGLPP